MERWLGRVGGIRTGSGRRAKVEDKVGRCAGSGGEAWPAPRACEPGGRVLGWAHSAAGAPGFKPPPARGRAAPWRRRSAWRLPLPAPRRAAAEPRTRARLPHRTQRSLLPSAQPRALPAGSPLASEFLGLVPRHPHLHSNPTESS